VEAPRRPGLLDRLVEILARLLNAIGLNGTRLQWKWSQRRRATAESAEQLMRSARGQHKMCPSCRALVPRRAPVCSECGERLAAVSAPGWGRVLGQLFPGASRAVSLLFLINGGLFALMLATPTEAVHAGGLSRLMGGFDTYTIMRYGGGLGVLILHDGEWWRLVTSMFLHANLLHIAMNSLALIRLGPLIEELYGAERFWVVYLGSGIAGAALSELPRPSVPVIGASGAICGLIGLLLAYGFQRGGMVGRDIRRSVFEMGLYILAFSLLPGVSLLGHVGGFVGGFLLGLVVPAGAPRSRLTNMMWQLAALAGVLLTLWAFTCVALHGEDFSKHLRGGQGAGPSSARITSASASVGLAPENVRTMRP
jgi:rhomboid protease GluP